MLGVLKKGFEKVQLFCFPDDVLNTDKPDVLISFSTFNDELIVVALFNVVFPEKINDDLHVVKLFNVVFPEKIKDDINVVGLLKIPI